MFDSLDVETELSEIIGIEEIIILSIVKLVGYVQFYISSKHIICPHESLERDGEKGGDVETKLAVKPFPPRSISLVCFHFSPLKTHPRRSTLVFHLFSSLFAYAIHRFPYLRASSCAHGKRRAERFEDN